MLMGIANTGKIGVRGGVSTIASVWGEAGARFA